MYLIINDIYSIYFPYFRLFLNCLLVDEEIGRILKISIMFCVGNCLINLCLNRIAIFCIGKSSAYRGFANGLIRSV